MTYMTAGRLQLTACAAPTKRGSLMCRYRGWRERLVDISSSHDDPLHLRMVLAPNETPASKLLLPRRLKALPPEAGEHHMMLPNGSLARKAG
jgi:hypothetical protein